MKIALTTLVFSFALTAMAVEPQSCSDLPDCARRLAKQRYLEISSLQPRPHGAISLEGFRPTLLNRMGLTYSYRFALLAGPRLIGHGLLRMNCLMPASHQMQFTCQLRNDHCDSPLEIRDLQKRVFLSDSDYSCPGYGTYSF